MTKSEFMTQLYREVAEFGKYWDQQQRTNALDWPNEMPEGEWWEQFMIWFDLEEGDHD